MLRRLIVVCTLAFVAQASIAQIAPPPADHPAKPKKPPGNCTVSGRVVSAAEGAPLRSARVGLVEANQPKHPTAYATVTDNDGHFEFKQVAAGRYEFFATKIGYLEQRYQSKSADDQGATLSLISGQTVDGAMFRMVRAAVVTGRVVDDTGEPMMGVNVSVLHKPSDEERENEGPRAKKLELTAVSVGQSDDRGEYRISNLKPGEYYLRAATTAEQWVGGGTIMMSASEWELAEELGSPYSSLFYPGVLQLDQAQTITLTAGEEARADFAMRQVKMVKVTGRVVGPDGGPGTRVYVRLSQPGVSDWGTGGASTDSSGEFSIKGVTPGSYVISAEMHVKGKFYSTRQKIEVGETNIDSVILALGGGATIHGHIRTASGAPLPAGRIMVRLESVEDEGGMGFGFTEVNKDGTFELTSVADGSYAISTSPIGEGWFIQAAHLGNEDALVNGVQVEGDAAKGALDIVASNDGAQIEGTVTDSDKGQPIAGAVVKAQVDRATDYNYMRSRTATTDQNGHFVLKDRPPGKYKVSAKIASPGPGLPAVKSEPVAVSVGEREHRTVDIKLAVPKSE